MADLPKLSQFSVSHCIKPFGFKAISSSQLHHFSDASEVGFQLCVANNKGDIHCSFLCAKSQVAPLKTIMIPRLELSAATISINQDKILRTELEALNDAQSIFWTDSTIVLRYIKNETNQYHTFIANHIAVIRHVHGDMNPADDASRGLTADNFLCQSSWLMGLEFLWKPKHEWPVQQKCLVVFRMKTLRSNRELRCACHWTSRIIPCQTTS